MKKLAFMACMLLSALAGFSQGIDVSKVYAIKNYNTAEKGECYIQDNGKASVGVNALNYNSYWVFEYTGTADHYYIKNFETGNYLQAYSISDNAVVSAGNTRAEYVVAKPSGQDYYGIALADQTNTSFNDASCKGLNFNSGDMIAQAFEAKAGTNMKSFWYLVEKGSNHSHNYTKGVCTVSGCLTPYQPATLNSGVYELTNAGNIEWFGAKIATGAVDPTNSNKSFAQGSYKMMNDIDFAGITHTPIGPNDTYKFNGTFDGDNHKITNMVLENTTSGSNVGFFFWVRGGSVIKNLTFADNCSFRAMDRAAAFICVIQAAAGGDIKIQNCANYAPVTTNNKVAAGFVAACNWKNTDQPAVNMTNCLNAGTITSTSDKTAAFFGWNKTATSTFTNCLNIGTLTKIDGTHNLVRSEDYSKIVFNNCYDFTSTTEQGKTGTDGLKTDWETTTPLSSGEACFVLNNNQTPVAWRQTLGSDDNPCLDPSHSIVYANGQLTCDGQPKSVTFSNTNTGNVWDAHVIKANGFCENCSLNPVTELLQDGDYLLVSNAAELEFLSSVVNAAGGATMKAKLTADIDLDGVTHTPIGFTDANKFCGEFDGQGHRILNMKAFSQDFKVGFFGGLRGNTTVQNIIIDKSCKLTGNRQMGGIAGACQTAVGPLNLINCINEADVEGTGWNIAGMIGENTTDDMVINITNCGNSGSIKADDANSCALFGWTKKGTITVENFWNTGTIVKGPNDSLERDGHAEDQALAFNFYNANQSVMDDNNVVLTNCYDASASAQRSQGTILEASAASSGELTYKLGGVWRQTFGEGGDTHPVFDQTHGIVNYISSAGYTTQYTPSTDVTIPSGITAYAGVINGSAIRLVAIEDAISKNDAVVLKGSEGYYSFVPTTGATPATDNDLKGSDGNVTSDGSTIFALSNKANGVGFYPVGNGVTIPEGKAYLEYTGTGSNAVKGFTFVFDDDATGISLMEDGRSQMEDGAIYNIAGQRLDNSQFTIHNSQLKRGIYIVNGKKVLK